MPGVSHRGPVPGSNGYGKVYLKFSKPKAKRSSVFGIVVYGSLFSLILFSYLWSRITLRNNFVVPLLRYAFDYLNCLKYAVYTESSILSQENSDNIILLSSDNTRNVMFKQGYAHATDRLLQMEIYRRTALGTLSELFGLDKLSSDKVYRTLNLRDIAKSDAVSLNKEDGDLFTAYTEGINQYISELSRSNSLPLDFELLLLKFKTFNVSSIPKWETFHSLAIMRLIAYEWSTGWEDDLQSVLLSNVANMTGKDLWWEPSSSTTSNNDSHFLPSLAGTVVAIAGWKSVTDNSLLVNSLSSMVSI